MPPSATGGCPMHIATSSANTLTGMLITSVVPQHDTSVIAPHCHRIAGVNRSTDDLTADGYAALEDGRLDDARAAAAALRGRCPAWYEIESRALWGRGEYGPAVALPEEGVRRSPHGLTSCIPR